MIITLGILIGTLIIASIYKINKAENDRDYWKAEALKWCGKLGEIRGLMETHNHNTP